MGFERQITLMIGCLETLFYGGTIFGWPSLVFVLKDIGYFGKDCLQTGDDVTTPASSSSASPRPPNEDHGSIDDDDAYFTNSSSLVACPTQDASLQLMYSVAIACQLFSFFPMGVLFDILGTRFTRLLFSVLLLAGNLLMGFSSPELPGLLYPGTILMVAGGTAVIISSMEIGNLFPSHKSTVITGLQGLYGSSQVVFFILKIAYEAGFSLYTAFFISAGCTLLLNINTFIFLPVNHIPWPLPQDYKLTIQCFSSPHKAPPPTASEMYNEAYVVDGGTAEEESQSDILKVSSYTNGFIIIQLTAILLGPLGGLVVERNRAGPCKKGNNTRSYYDDILDCCLPLALPSLLSAAYSGIFLIPNLEVQYLAFMIFTFFRVFFFGTGPVIIASIFPQKYFGRIYGVIRTITGCVTLLQYPIFILIQEYLDDDPFYVMIGFAVADLLTLFSPVFLYITTKNKMNNTDQNQTQQ
ncbi:solute carrier family 43 member 3 isoform X2 [Strongylocentrotus purpuratus]|uniref:Solute carrier family 43 member 3 n=1 Tax=Strongylocentrotus purpuratus TaxID=7668 RepID=A0A7M7N8M7_STRPU|nr:solute carrier family 43 member 3 isoform X2 [Strongylocentrotus purpuratus]